MTHAAAAADPAGPALDDFDPQRPLRLGAVSYLNTAPLVTGLEHVRGLSITRAAPSRLSDMLAAGDLDLALVPIIDFQTSACPLAVIPVGMIGCDGPTMTVRLFSAGPLEAITRVHADTDSRTSVALVRILLQRLHGATPRVVDFDARERVATSPAEAVEWPDSFLLIGDKVVSDSPPAVRYPHQMDLGDAWKRLTGLPFVYAAWMCRAERAGDGDIALGAALLDRQRRHNATRLDWIVSREAPRRGFPADLAREYVGSLLRFDLDDAARSAIERFFDLAHEHGIIPRRIPTLWAPW